MKINHYGGLILFFVLCVAACAPGLGTTLNNDAFDALPSADSNLRQGALQVRVGRLLDTRLRRAIGQVGQREIEPSQDVEEAVTKALQSELKRAGYRLALFEAALLSGEVREWFVTISPDFPVSVVQAKAALRLQVTDTSGRVSYSGLYSGSVEERHPWMGEGKVSSVLAQAMTYALREALQDEKLLSEIERSG